MYLGNTSDNKVKKQELKVQRTERSRKEALRGLQAKSHFRKSITAGTKK